MNDKPRRSQKNQSDNRQTNWWKWAFVCLVALVAGGMLYLVFLLQPITVNEGETSTEPIGAKEDAVVLTTRTNKADAQTLINTYLNEAVGEGFSGYQVALSDQLEIHGSIPVLGLEVPFSLYFTPYVLENGNVQLRGEAVEVANYSMPVQAVMSIVAHQVDFPDFISVDSSQQLVLIDLHELSENFSFSVTAERIDLQEDEISLNLWINEGTISDTIQRNEMNESNE